MKENKLWNNCLYPLLEYYVIISIAMFLAEVILPGQKDHYMIWQTAATVVTIPFIYFSFYKADHMFDSPKQVEKTDIKWLLLMILALIAAAMSLSQGINNFILLTPLDELSANYATASDNFYASTWQWEVVGSAVLTPILEELLYRGVIFARIRKNHDFWFAALTSSFLFGFMHFNLVQFVYAFCLGLALAYLMEKGGHVFFAMLGHMVANGYAILRTETGIFNTIEQNAFSWVTASGLCIMGIGFILIFSDLAKKQKNR